MYIGQDQNQNPVADATVSSPEPVHANSLTLSNGAQLHTSAVHLGGNLTINGNGSGQATGIIGDLTIHVGGNLLVNATTAAEIISDSVIEIDDVPGNFTVSAIGSSDLPAIAAVLAFGDLTVGNIGGNFRLFEANGVATLTAASGDVVIGDIDGIPGHTGLDAATGNFTIGEQTAESDITYAGISSSGDVTIGNIASNFLNQGFIEADYGMLSIGTVGGSFVNSGLLSAHQIMIACNDNETLDNQGKLLVEGIGPISRIGIAVYNSGLVKASDYAKLAFNETVGNAESGLIKADQHSKLRFESTVFNLGAIIVAAHSADSFLDSVRNHGLILADSGAQTDFCGGVSNGHHGVIKASDGGEVTFHDVVGNKGLIIAVDCGSTVDFYCGLVKNGGVIKAVYDGHVGFHDEVRNRGDIKAAHGGSIDFDGTVHNMHGGLILADGCGSVINFDCGWAGNSGNIVAANDGEINFYNGIHNLGRIVAKDGGFIDLHGAVHNGGVIAANGCGSEIDFGCGFVGNDGVIKAVHHGYIDFNDHVFNNGLIKATHGGTIGFDGGVHNSGTILAATGSEIHFDCGWVDNNGAIVADWGGHVDFNHWVGGDGVLVADGGTIELASGTCNDIQFGSNCGSTLVLDDAQAHIGSISGFGHGESIDFAGQHDVSICSYVADQCGAGGVLNLYSCEAGDFSLSFTGDYALGNFALVQTACGTQIVDQGPVLTLDNPQVAQVPTGFCGGAQDSTEIGHLQIFAPFATDHWFDITATAGEGKLLLLEGQNDLNVTYADCHQTLSACGTLADLNEALAHGVLYTTDQSVANGDSQVNDMVAVKITDLCTGAIDAINFVFNAANPNGDAINLTGTAGKDFIYASGYDDTLAGGASADTFVFGPQPQQQQQGQQSPSHDVITDFNVHQDFLDFDHSIFADVAAVLASAHDDVHGNAVITDTAGNSVTLDHVTTDQLVHNQSHLLVA